IVSTEPLVDVYKGLIDDIVVLPNYLEKTIWAPLTSKRRQGKKPRVGWAGAQQHQGDLELLIPIIEATKDEVEWVFFGMYLLEFKYYIKELHDGVIIEQYPKKLASLNLDLAIAPLEINSFNESKSNLRILEYGNMGWPVICTDIIPYQNAPVTRLPNQPDLWIKTIRDYIHELDHLEKQGDQLQQWVRKNWMLDDHVDEWLKALLSDAQYRQYFN
ncbi:MAG: O-antigen biosynthesis protein, partial [Methylococcales bacterium]|nr:O-antigen biosynthesis protein [Methylococcales bacterium]